MTKQELFHLLKEKFLSFLQEKEICGDAIDIVTKTLTPEEAIGITKRKDFPIITGKEVMLQAEYRGSRGQAFTDAPTVFRGTLKEICEMDLENDVRARGLFIASLNAVMCYFGLADRTVHCKGDIPEQCAHHIVERIKKEYGNPKVLLVGYQPAILENCASQFETRVLDLSPANIGEIRYHVKVEHGVEDYESAVAWADLILCTGSTVCNGSIVNYLGLDQPVLFFGTTLSGVADWLGAQRICFAEETEI